MKQPTSAPVAQIATRKRAHYEMTYQFVSEQFASWAKWLNVSLFGINGAALLTAANKIAELEEFTAVAFAFATGLALSLISGMALQEYYSRIHPLLRRLTQYWMKVEQTEKRNVKFEKHLVTKIEKIQRLSWIPPLAGWLSAASFVFGVTVFALNIQISANAS